MGITGWFRALFQKKETEDSRKDSNEVKAPTQVIRPQVSVSPPPPPDSIPAAKIPPAQPAAQKRTLEEDLFLSPEETDRKIAEAMRSQVVNEREKPVEKKAPITPRPPKRINVWVGIDFGTSYTKLAYRVLGGTGKVLPLNLGANLKMPYAVPSLVAFDGGRILFGDEADRFLRGRPWHEGARYLKILFAGDLNPVFLDENLKARFDRYCEDQQVDQALLKPGYMVAAFLAHLIRKIRQQLGRISDQEQLINFNVCIPIDTFEMKDVRTGFQRAINVAESIEEKWNGQRAIELLENAAAIWNRAPDSETRESRIHLVPEAVAQMACYVNSLAAETKIHGVIDFGAGTTDFSIFNLCEEKEEEEGKCAYWYNAITFPGGMAKIEDRVATWNREKGREMDYFQLQSVMEGLSQKEPEIQAIVKEELQKLWEEARYHAWGTAFKKRRKETQWYKDKVKVFVCGGGSKIPYVRDIFGRCWHCDEWGPYEVTALTAPSDFEGAPKDFPRLAVAYGLTIPRPELAKYVLPRDCPDQTPPPLPPVWESPSGAVYDDDYR